MLTHLKYIRTFNIILKWWVAVPVVVAGSCVVVVAGAGVVGGTVVAKVVGAGADVVGAGVVGAGVVVMSWSLNLTSPMCTH